MVLEFRGDAQEKVYSAMMNNIAYQSYIGVLSGCEVTADAPTSMDVVIDSGNIFFGNDIVAVAGGTETIAANATSYTRYDLIAVDNTGTTSVIQGTAAAVPVTPDYDADTYTIFAIITVSSGTTTIETSDIKDIRVLNQGGAGGADSSIGRYRQTFTTSTSETVTHNLGDDEPLVFVYDSTGQLVIPDDVTITDENELVVTFSVSSTGTIIVYGGVGTATSYYTEDFTSSTTWTVNHNLGRQYVQVACYDSSDNLIEPLNVNLVSDSQVSVTWGVATAGRVVVTGGSSQPGIIGFTPYSSSAVDNNSMFLDSSDSVIKLKDNSGNVKSVMQWELLDSDVLTGTSNYLEVTGLTTTNYDQLRIVFRFHKNDRNGNSDTIQLQFNSDTGANYYSYYLDDGAKSTSSGATSMYMGESNATGDFGGCSGVLETLNTNDSGMYYPEVHASVRGKVDHIWQITGYWKSANKITAVKISLANSALMDIGGFLEVWGLKNQ